MWFAYEDFRKISTLDAVLGVTLPTHLAEESIAARRQKLEAEAQEYRALQDRIEAEPKSARE